MCFLEIPDVFSLKNKSTIQMLQFSTEQITRLHKKIKTTKVNFI